MNIIIEELKNRQETVWINPERTAVDPEARINGYGFLHIKAAQNRFMRFMPFIASAFPETAAKMGVIESNLIPIPEIREWMNANGANISGRLFLKDDAHLPIAGSVKARGGINAVMRIAESLAQKEDKLKPTDSYAVLDSEEFRSFYSQYTIQVGSTGNLGLSIGLFAAKLGFKTIVHMSCDAKEWKKELLRKAGAEVRSYEGDYSLAVKEGREASAQDDTSFFVDDENSEDLFFGYATAAMRLKIQLYKAGVKVDEEHPLFVYLPCGVGGAPGGITFGMRILLGDNVHCFFAEPTEAPCMLLGMASGKRDGIAIQEIGLSGRTIADGLAVSRPSGFVCSMMPSLMSGAYTVTDEQLTIYRNKVQECIGIGLEPSACAGFKGAEQMERAGEANAFAAYIAEHGLASYMEQASHIVWATGGGLMPEEV